MHVRARVRACVESAVGEKGASLFRSSTVFLPTLFVLFFFYGKKHSLRSTQSTANVIRVQTWPPSFKSLEMLIC